MAAAAEDATPALVNTVAAPLWTAAAAIPALAAAGADERCRIRSKAYEDAAPSITAPLLPSAAVCICALSMPGAGTEGPTSMSETGSYRAHAPTSVARVLSNSNSAYVLGSLSTAIAEDSDAVPSGFGLVAAFLGVSLHGCALGGACTELNRRIGALPLGSGPDPSPSYLESLEFTVAAL